MAFTEQTLELDNAHISNLFGQFDCYLKKLERAFGTQIIDRDGTVHIRGEQSAVAHTAAVFTELQELARRGNQIQEQNVDYAIAMHMENQENTLLEIDGDLICHTVSGKPVKPKTLGQKQYVDAIREKMIVFGLGPAGTGKTYLAMAMAITAFKNNEVERIILTRPAIEAGEKLGFLPGDLQSKVDPYLRPLYDALYQIMGAESFQRNMEKGLIEVAPLAYMRGRTLDNAYIILDEAQKYDACPNEDVPDPNRLRFQGCHHRRRFAERPCSGNTVRSGRCCEGVVRSGRYRLLQPDKPRCRPASAGSEDCQGL